jgi:deoxyribonuclease-4
MLTLGAHMSIAGGYYKAVEEAAKCRMATCQIFTKNNNQWRAKEISDDDVRLFQDALKQHGIGQPTSHASYLINLGSPVDELWQKSIEGMVVELERAAKLGVTGVVMHPGAGVTLCEADGVARVAAAIDEIHRRLPECSSQILLENTAGQGTCLGWKFEHLADIIAATAQPERLGVCFDTCHAFAAGYAITDPADYKKTWKTFDKLVGIERIKAFHLNDSKKDFGSRVDRHDHIGRGKIGLEAFRNLLNDKRFRHVPMYLETAKEEENGESLDMINLRTLRSLVA